LRIEKIVIPASILAKLHWKHHVSEEEVDQVLRGKPKLFFVEKGNIRGEDVYLALGKTEGGRYLSIFFVYKVNKTVIVISARDMTKKERIRHEKK